MVHQLVVEILPTDDSSEPIPIGTAGSFRPRELGYGYHPDYYGKGYATEAAVAYCEWFRKQYPGERMFATSFPANEASVKVLEKCGFGPAREGEVSDWPVNAMGRATWLDRTLDEKTADFQVNVKVNGEKFVMSAKLLSEHSAFFEHHLADFWKTGKARETIIIHNEEPAVFELFSDWLSFGDIFTGTERSLDKLSYSVLFKAFVLGLTLRAQVFRNDVMDIITAKFDAGHMPEAILPEIAYNGTPPSSPLRRILVDVYAYRGGPAFVTAPTTQNHISSQFLTDLTCALYNLRDKGCSKAPYPFGLEQVGCQYHYHGLYGKSDCPGPRVPASPKTEGSQDDGMNDETSSNTDTNRDRSASDTQLYMQPEMRRPTTGSFLTPVMTRIVDKDTDAYTRDSGIAGMRYRMPTVEEDDEGAHNSRRMEESTPCPEPTISTTKIKRERFEGQVDGVAAPTAAPAAKKRKLTAAEKKRIQELKSQLATKDAPISLD
ncbi:Transcription elongation factor S-II [Elsinoe australis]|uniref:Transcription elongation factor S-II n=1 Tax=Elsinoe australis TaxID=40998 RepID=A0A2P8A2T5_9PEZI|nr:Transcription elongation factor S-II [Elsinoe australis]